MGLPVMTPVKALSLFTGAGGLDIGFHAAGFDIVACVEIEKRYCKTLEANKGTGKAFGSETRVLREDVRDFYAEEYASQGIRCVIGGPPCQTFSAAGRRSGGVLGTSDARGRLFKAYCQILKVIEPEVFVFENVYGLPGANNGDPWREITTAFSGLGYHLAADVLDAADYGVPQHRERLIMVGYRAGEFEFPAPTHGPDSPDKRKLVSVREAIADLQDRAEPDHDDLGGLYGHLLALVPPGLNYAFFTREMGHPEPIFAWRSKFHDFLYKADPDFPCRTIKARPGKFSGPFHWKNRSFTVEELKRLQGFPDDYVIVGNYGRILEQIGNSVPPLLARILAMSVREQLLEHRQELTYPRRPFGFSATFRQRQRERTKHFRTVAERAIAERYSGTGTPERKKSDQRAYYVFYEGFFSKSVVAKKPATKSDGRAFKVSIESAGENVQLRLERVNAGKARRRRIKIEVGGLYEGLTAVRTLTANASVTDLHDIFFMWDTIEDLLIRNSKFLTLIDVYGHYANRGDTVTVRTDIIGGVATVLTRALRFFGDSLRCGEAISRAVIRSELSVTDGELDELISEMRSMRFDIRTRQTHPTIAAGMVLCTYPFPLLSQKAHLERRLKAQADQQEIEQVSQGLLFT
jgi:DNA (cytosine-5)-methyltransferase 1